MPNKEENRVTVFVAQRKQCRCQEWLELASRVSLDEGHSVDLHVKSLHVLTHTSWQ